ncbi:MAG: metallophosphoesterase family protein [Planctomycetota bacterium]|jgi:predicted phosphodiesterase
MKFGKRWSWRGKILLVLGLAIGGFVGLGWFAFGLRLPPLQWEPATRATQMESSSGDFYVEAQGAYFVEHREDVLVFRAFVPEPTLIVSAKRETEAKVVVQNLSPQLLAGPVAATGIDGLERTYSFPIQSGIGLLIQPRFPAQKTGFRFAAIGDTGGEQEIQDAVDRAEGLGADFLLHLGDIEYQEGALLRAAKILNAASIPTYVAIGNHDFHDGLRLVHRDFTEFLGPRNSVFTLGGVQFLNLDTAADTYPAPSGERGRLISRLLDKEIDRTGEVVVFTHRPLWDPRLASPEEDGHDIGSKAEKEWLASVFSELGVDLLLHGHIHQSFAFETAGIPSYIVGNGLLLEELDSSRAEPSLLIGEWSLDAPQVRRRWEPLQP